MIDNLTQKSSSEQVLKQPVTIRSVNKETPSSFIKPSPHFPRLIIVIAFLLIVVGGVSVFVLYSNHIKLVPQTNLIATPTSISDPTANWKTYTSDQLKFIIKYPNDWFFAVDTLTSFDREIAKRGNLPKEPFQTCHFIPYNPPLFNVLSETVIQNSQPQIVKQRVIDKSIQPQSDKNAFTIYSIKQNGFSTVEVTCIDQSGIYDAKIVQILSTFKFIQSQQQTEFISGKLCYPADHVPSGKITAKNIDTGEITIISYKWDGHSSDNPTYKMELKPGNYHVKYESIPDPGDATGMGTSYYTDLAKCTFSQGGCNSQPRPLLTVTVRAGETISGIHPCDNNTLPNPPDF